MVLSVTHPSLNPQHFVNRTVCLVELKWLVANVFIILYSHSRARPLGMLGAGDKKSLLTSTTALRAVELCWVHSDRPVITAGGCTGVAYSVLVHDYQFDFGLLKILSGKISSKMHNYYSENFCRLSSCRQGNFCSDWDY
jgi:hypothetical protein